MNKTDAIILALQLLKNYGPVRLVALHGMLVASPDDITAILQTEDILALKEMGWFDGDGTWKLQL